MKRLRIAFWGRQPRPKTKGETNVKSTFKTRYTRSLALLAVGIIAAIGAARAGGWRDDDDGLAQRAELEQLHAPFTRPSACTIQ